MVIMMSFFGQWSGNNVVSYFMVSRETTTSQCSHRGFTKLTRVLSPPLSLK
jgi:hypothetical protein